MIAFTFPHSSLSQTRFLGLYEIALVAILAPLICPCGSNYIPRYRAGGLERAKTRVPVAHPTYCKTGLRLSEEVTFD